MARFRSGDAMTNTDGWRCASPETASKQCSEQVHGDRIYHRRYRWCAFGLPSIASSRSLNAMPRVVIDPALPDRELLDNEIARLRGLDVGELRARWHTVFRRAAPPHLPRHLLFRILAYRLQADQLGDLDADTRRVLERIGSGPSEGIGRLGTELRPGTLLTREWHGHLQQVIVLADGDDCLRPCRGPGRKTNATVTSQAHRRSVTAGQTVRL